MRTQNSIEWKLNFSFSFKTTIWSVKMQWKWIYRLNPLVININVLPNSNDERAFEHRKVYEVHDNFFFATENNFTSCLLKMRQIHTLKNTS
jgi:hypothetical protein